MTCFYEINFYDCFWQPYFPSYKIDNVNMFLNCKFLWCWWNIIKSYAWYWKGGIFTPFIIVCHKVDRYVMDAVNLSQIHPQGGGLLRCWNCALTSISCQIWSQSIYRITGVIFVVSCEKLILLIRLFNKRNVICKKWKKSKPHTLGLLFFVDDFFSSYRMYKHIKWFAKNVHKDLLNFLNMNLFLDINFGTSHESNYMWGV